MNLFLGLIIFAVTFYFIYLFLVKTTILATIITFLISIYDFIEIQKNNKLKGGSLKNGKKDRL
jgi:hypothetical protein